MLSQRSLSPRLVADNAGQSGLFWPSSGLFLAPGLALVAV